MELAKLTKGAVAFYNLDGEEIQKEMKTIEWDAEAAEKSGYEHFMLKEIHEQPKVIKDTINSVLTDGNISFESECEKLNDIMETITAIRNRRAEMNFPP